MSTTAAIFYYNPETDLYDGVTVQYDGYIKDGGVGETLFLYWNSTEKVKELCTDKRSAIRSIDTTIIDWYDDDDQNRAKRWKNQNWMALIDSKFGSVDYSYIFKNNEWYVFNKFKGCTLIPLKNYFIK